MSETAGPAPGYKDMPEHFVDFEPSPKRIRVSFGGETIVDTTNGLIVYERGHVPVYYMPRADVAMDLLTASAHSTHCPFKGDASYWNITVGDRVAENALWSYPDPISAVPELKGHAAFYWNRMERWLEEDEEIFVHARDPHVRIDILPSSRRVEISLDGTVLADSTQALFLFETGLPVRYYIPAEDLRHDVLVVSELETACPYKGIADYHHVDLAGTRHENLVWHYTSPVREAAPIRDYHCFFNERVDIRVDGLLQDRPKTKWSPK